MSKEIVKSYGKSIRSKLLNISKNENIYYRTVLTRCFQERLDIDFLGNDISNNGERIIAAFREICSVPCEEDGVKYDVEHITSKNITELKD